MSKILLPNIFEKIENIYKGTVMRLNCGYATCGILKLDCSWRQNIVSWVTIHHQHKCTAFYIWSSTDCTEMNMHDKNLRFKMAKFFSVENDSVNKKLAYDWLNFLLAGHLNSKEVSNYTYFTLSNLTRLGQQIIFTSKILVNMFQSIITCNSVNVNFSAICLWHYLLYNGL